MYRIALIASVLLAGSALLAPAALAQRPDDRAGIIGIGNATAPVTEVASSSATRPDDRAGIIGIGNATAPVTEVASSSATRPDDRAGVRGPGAFSAGPPTILVSSDGFDWSDAGVGLAGGLGLALIAGVLLVTATHRRRPHQLA